MFLTVIDGIFLALQAVLQLIPRPVASLASQHLSLVIDSSVNTVWNRFLPDRQIDKD
jgi:hypothetical protein